MWVYPNHPYPPWRPWALSPLRAHSILTAQRSVAPQSGAAPQPKISGGSSVVAQMVRRQPGPVPPEVQGKITRFTAGKGITGG